MRNLTKKYLTDLIKAKAFDLGFDKIGIVKLSKFEEEEIHLKKWLENGMNAEMQYMNRNVEKRIDPNLITEGSKSAIVVLHNYFSAKVENSDKYNISQYALGLDYHSVMKNKLAILLNSLKALDATIDGRCFVDSAPILERALARNAGLGWVGKNSCLINKDLGSFFFIGEIFINLELEYDKKLGTEFCGSCSKCIDACPTKAIEFPYVINANKCISYQTIENKKEISTSLKGKYQNWIFGCDICQNVCPWNNKPVLTNEESYLTNKHINKNTNDFWENLSHEEFNALFKNTPIERTGYDNLKRNIDFLKNSSES